MSERLFTADLHTHLLEKKTKPRDYWKSVKARKIDIVAITEHAECKPRKAFEMLEKTKPKNVLLVPGIEINSEIGHVLVYGKDESVFEQEEFFKKNARIKEIIQIAEKNNFLLSISHPWGLSYDSAAFIMGEKKLEKLVRENRIGVEAFNGMMGQLSYFVYKSNWVKKPLNFFERLENNRVAKKIRLSKIGKKAREKISEKSLEIIERTAKPIALGNKASFITAGSDAHSAARIGAGIIKIRLPEKTGIEEFLSALEQKKGIEWIGPLVKQKNGSMEIVKLPRKKIEALQAFKYAAKRYIMKKAGVRQRTFGKQRE